MQEVSALSDAIVVIAGGRITAQGSPDDLRRQSGRANLEDAFVALAGLDERAESPRSSDGWRIVPDLPGGTSTERG
jgi:ABC-type multidrug transport system ATPase subunit